MCDFSNVSSAESGKILGALFTEELHQMRGRDIAEAMFLAGATILKLGSISSVITLLREFTRKYALLLRILDFDPLALTQ